MQTDWESNCLVSMATRRRRRGLSRAEAIRDIDIALRGFSTRFRIGQAVRTVYDRRDRII